MKWLIVGKLLGVLLPAILDALRDGKLSPDELADLGGLLGSVLLDLKR